MVATKLLFIWCFHVFVQTGVMETHDEETRKFFKHSSVMCVLAPRYASSKMSFIKQQASIGWLIFVDSCCVVFILFFHEVDTSHVYCQEIGFFVY